MAGISTVAVGVRVYKKMFRLESNWGQIADFVMEARGKKGLPEDYYNRIAHSGDKTLLSNDDLGHELRLSNTDIVFVNKTVEDKGTVDLDKSMTEFTRVIETLNEALNINVVRRLGIVIENRIKATSSNASTDLVEKVTTIPNKIGLPAKFALTLENRRTTLEGVSPDMDKDDFVNVIWQLYDSAADSEVPADGYINANVDYQRYYMPAFAGDIAAEVSKLLVRARKENDSILSFANLAFATAKGQKVS